MRRALCATLAHDRRGRALAFTCAQILVSWAILPRYTSETMMEVEADMLASAQRITAGYACHKPLCLHLHLALCLALCPGPRRPQPWALLARVLRHPAPAPSVGLLCAGRGATPPRAPFPCRAAAWRQWLCPATCGHLWSSPRRPKAPMPTSMPAWVSHQARRSCDHICPAAALLPAGLAGCLASACLPAGLPACLPAPAWNLRRRCQPTCHHAHKCALSRNCSCRI